MDFATTVFSDVVASLVGIFIGTLLALYIDRRNAHRRLRRRSKVVLRSLALELNEDYQTIKDAKAAYLKNPWGKSFYLSTVAWETALAGGDLPAVIGFEMADTISAQYALYIRIRYYVDLLTQLWFAPSDVAGYDQIRRGFNQAIVAAMTRAIGQHAAVMSRIERDLKARTM